MVSPGVGHVLALLIVVIVGAITAGCDDQPDAVRLVNGVDFRPGISIAPTPIALAPLSDVPCPLGGVAFDTTFHLIVNAGVHDVTLDSITVHMVDGSNLGGPSVTIPQPELSARFGSMLIAAGTTRDFAVRPNFGCVPAAPTALRSNTFVVDSRGIRQTMVVEGRVR
jgi:hypothetical protein